MVNNHPFITNNRQSVISIYPNPLKSGNAYLKFNNSDYGEYFIYIFNESGDKLGFSKFHYDGSNNSYRLPFNGITQNGLYHVNIVFDNKKTIILPLVLNR